MKTKFLFALLIIVLGITLCPAPPPVYPPGRGGGGGTGGVYSNDTRTAVITTFYTNNTPHYIDGIARLGYSGAGTLTVSVTNSDNTRFFPFVYDALSVGATSNSLPFKVPPGGWWKFSGTGSTATDGTQVLTYNATNGAVTYATTAGSVPGGVTEAGLAAGSYNLGTNVLTRSITNQWSRGTGRYYGAVITDGGLPVPSNNGWGSVDLQPSLFPQDGFALDSSANTNSAGGRTGFIGGGQKNLIRQTQEGYDANGWQASSSVIGGGYGNLIIDASEATIGGGYENYIGPQTIGESGAAGDDCVISGGAGNRVYGIDSGIGSGISNTNNSSNAFIGGGSGNYLESGSFIGAGNNNRVISSGFVVAGEGNIATNSPRGGILGHTENVVRNAADAFVLGNYLTNTTAGSIMIGLGTNYVSISTNAGVFTSGRGVSTNRNFVTTSAGNPFPDLDTAYTNRNQRAYVYFYVSATGVLGSGDTARGYLLVDQDANGTWEEDDAFVGQTDLVGSFTFQISRRLQPGARFMLAQTNAGFGITTLESSSIDYE